MKDRYKTKTQLIEELEMLRKQVVKLKKVETKRKQEEDALKFTRFSVDNAAGTMVWVDQDGRFIDVNNAFCRSVGYSREELLSMTVQDIDPGYSAEIWPEFWEKLKQGGSLTFESCHHTKEGKVFPVEITASFLEYQGKEYHCGFACDITERKKAEEALKHQGEGMAALQKTLLEITSSQDLSLLLQNIVSRAAGLLNSKGGGLYLCEPGKREVRCVVSYNTLHDYIGTVLKFGEGAAGMVAETGQPLVIDDYRTWGKRAATYEKDNPFTAVLSVPMTWGGEVIGVIHVLDNVETRHFTESDLQLLEMFASHAAITVRNARLIEQAQKEIIERMRVEEELRKREKEITFIAENVPALFSYLDANGCYRFINKRYEEWFNIPRAQIIGKHYKEVLGEAVSEEIKGFVEAALRGEEVNYEAPLPYSRGGTRWVLAKYVPDIDDQRKVIGFLALVMDITERKRAEEALRRKSGEQDLLLGNIQTQIWYLTDKETYGAVNKARVNFFGKKKEEIENKKVYDLLGKDEAEICMSGYAEVFEKRKQIHTEEWIMDAKGEKRLLSITKSPKLNENGDVEYVVCSAEDVTDRKRTEEEIHTYQEKLRSLSSELSLIEERERRRIATDLHDYIGQNLALTKMRLGALRELAFSSDFSTLVEEIQTLTDQAIHYTRSLTSDLSPPALYELGFDAAVEWLIEQIQDQHHILVDFEEDRQSKPMSDEIRISLFKAVRELLINIAKHAKIPKAKVSTRTEDNIIRIIVEDDGVGFSIPEDKSLTKIGGFGLFSIRERLRYLGGNFEIESNPGQGTRITLVAPLMKEENNNRSVT